MTKSESKRAKSKARPKSKSNRKQASKRRFVDIYKVALVQHLEVTEQSHWEWSYRALVGLYNQVHEAQGKPLYAYAEFVANYAWVLLSRRKIPKPVRLEYLKRQTILQAADYSPEDGELEDDLAG
jgi:hypothetical protein